LQATLTRSGVSLTTTPEEAAVEVHVQYEVEVGDGTDGRSLEDIQREATRIQQELTNSQHIAEELNREDGVDISENDVVSEARTIIEDADGGSEDDTPSENPDSDEEKPRNSSTSGMSTVTLVAVVFAAFGFGACSGRFRSKRGAEEFTNLNSAAAQEVNRASSAMAILPPAVQASSAPPAGISVLGKKVHVLGRVKPASPVSIAADIELTDAGVRTEPRRLLGIRSPPLRNDRERQGKQRTATPSGLPDAGPKKNLPPGVMERVLRNDEERQGVQLTATPRGLRKTGPQKKLPPGLL